MVVMYGLSVREMYRDEAPTLFGTVQVAAIPQVGDRIHLKWLDGDPAYPVRVLKVHEELRIDVVKEGDLSFAAYQLLAHSTAKYPREQGLYYTALGLAGEAGELANKVKKVIRDYGGDPTALRAAMLQELGDALWYVSEIATVLGVDLEQIALGNVDKLQGRDVRGTIQGSGDQR